MSVINQICDMSGCTLPQGDYDYPNLEAIPNTILLMVNFQLSISETHRTKIKLFLHVQLVCL